MLEEKIRDFELQISDEEELKSLALQTLQDRTIEFKPPKSRNVIISSYFTSKVDPQRKVIQQTNSFEYIKSWYISIVENNSTGIILFDQCSDDFIKEFTNYNIQFVKCSLGAHSLNDERYFLFFAYIAHYYNQLDYVLITDINDVIFNNNPFEWLIKFEKDQILLGRNNTNRFIDSQYNLERLMNLEKSLNFVLPNEFFLFPVYNAGVTGGNTTIILYFLLLLTKKISQLSKVYNNNMISYNLVIFENFDHPIYIKYRYKLTRLFPRWLFFKAYNFLIKFLHKNRRIVRQDNDNIALTRNIRTSSPYLNPYKSFNTSKRYYIIHK